MDKGMKKRWISLYVENQVGVLSKISGLFSGKSYNLDSLTVGTTEDPTVSRMTIATVSDDETFEQIKKQLNRMIEVIKVIDFTDVFVRMKEILYIKVFNCSREDKAELFQIAETFKAKVIDYGKDSLLLEFVQTATKNDAVVKLIKEEFHRIEVVRGGYRNTSIFCIYFQTYYKILQFLIKCVIVYGSVIRKKMHLISTSDSLVDKVIHFTVWLNL